MVRMNANPVLAGVSTVGMSGSAGGSISSSGMGGSGGMGINTNYKKDLIWSATVNLANSIVGVSLLSMPYALKRAGLILGLLCIFSCAYFTYISCRFLARAACATRRKSFQYLVLFSNGVAGKTIVELSVIGLNIGACVAFFVVIGDVAAEFLARYVTPVELSFYKNTVLVVLATVIVLPLALVPDIGKFASLSAFSLGFYILFALYVFWAYMRSSGPTDAALKASASKYPWVWYNLDGVIEVAPIIAGSFTCQPALFPLMELLEDDTPKSIEYVTQRAMVFVAALYSSVGVFGYLMFGESALGDMLHNFNQSALTDFFKLSFAFSILFSFPLVVYPLRSSLETLLFQNLAHPSSQKRSKVVPISNYRYESEIESTSSDEYSNSGRDPNNNTRRISSSTDGGSQGGVHIPSSRFMKMTFFIVAFTLTTGILIPHVEKILAFTGSTAGMLISMIVPSIIYMRVLPKAGPKKAKLILFCGLILMFVGTLNVLSTSSSSTDSVTQILYEKSLRRPDMFKIDEAIKEDYLKQKKLIEEQIAAQEQKLAKDEEELKKRKEELEKQKVELIGQPKKPSDQQQSENKQSDKAGENKDGAQPADSKQNVQAADKKSDGESAEKDKKVEQQKDSKQDGNIAGKSDKAKELNKPESDEQSAKSVQKDSHSEVKSGESNNHDPESVKKGESDKVDDKAAISKDSVINNAAQNNENIIKEKQPVVEPEDKVKAVLPEAPEQMAKQAAAEKIVAKPPVVEVAAPVAPEKNDNPPAPAVPEKNIPVEPESKKEPANVEPAVINEMPKKDGIGQKQEAVNPAEAKGVVADDKKTLTNGEPGVPAKTGAEDGLLKQLKETQELQEKLMIHQNDLINKLEGEHEPHAAGEQQKPDDKKGVVNAKVGDIKVNLDALKHQRDPIANPVQPNGNVQAHQANLQPQPRVVPNNILNQQAQQQLPIRNAPLNNNLQPGLQNNNQKRDANFAHKDGAGNVFGNMDKLNEMGVNVMGVRAKKRK
ncbi:uncharacterized protein LOC142345669 isoform X2 [Convolutriloba macropyga]|uniref:uncharacterized protein LOC142345669 isoform X2 n=1 Tax=Convolutriloba macropyga TaxID=536237 RepID=UPI003F51B651